MFYVCDLMCGFRKKLLTYAINNGNISLDVKRKAEYPLSPRHEDSDSRLIF